MQHYPDIQMHVLKIGDKEVAAGLDNHEEEKGKEEENMKYNFFIRSLKGVT
jgi:hypothetical protein